MNYNYRTPEECKEIFALIDSKKKKAAAAHLRSWFADLDRERLRRTIAEHGHYSWIFHLYDDEVEKEPSHQGKAIIAAREHIRFATLVRNELRTAGFGESDLGIRNLDDVYIFLLEEALMEAA
jgi:hypothetical protein